MLCADFIVPRTMDNLKVMFIELQSLKWRYFYNVIPRANKNTECLLTLTLWCHPRTEHPVIVSRKRKRDGNRKYICWRGYKNFADSAVLFIKGISYRNTNIVQQTSWHKSWHTFLDVITRMDGTYLVKWTGWWSRSSNCLAFRLVLLCT
jgi:hypothetical protein